MRKIAGKALPSRVFLLGPLAAVFVLLLSPGIVRAAPTFDKEAPVALFSAAVQAFTYSTPAAAFTYPIRMYFLRPNSGLEVGSALSADGINWVEDSSAGRLSVNTLPAASASSITGCGVLPLNGGGYRMLYSILSSTGSYRIHSATSTDGLAWANDAGVRQDNGATYLASPKLVALNDGSWRLYYVGNTDGGVDLANRAIWSARSTDQGLTWSAATLLLTPSAYEVGASVLTNGTVRLYLTAPASGSSTATVVLSALSNDASGSAFSIEGGLRISTTAMSGSLGFPVPVRSTDSFRWRLYYDFSDVGGLTAASVHTALTGAPAPVAISPNTVLSVSSTETFTIRGDIFSTPPPTVKLSMSGQPDILPLTVTRTDDQTLSATFNVANQATGRRDVTVMNADARSATLAQALLIDFPGGSLSLVNNLLRPRTGAKTSIFITTFNDGNILARLYTLDGRPVRTLFDAEKPKGVLTLTWDGRDAGGAAVASGVYLLRVLAPKVNLKEKIIVVR